MKIAALMLLGTLLGCGGSTEPSIDATTAPVEGTYDMISQDIASGGPIFSTKDVTHFNTDVYALSAGKWTRAYDAVSTSPDGTRRPFTGTASGTYIRAGSSLTFTQQGQTDLHPSFTGRGMIIVEGEYKLTYRMR